jgi:hypothetical protein
MPLQVLRTREAFRAAGHGTDMRALSGFVRLGHPTSAAFLDEVRDGHRGRNVLASCGILGFSLFRGDHDDGRIDSSNWWRRRRRWWRGSFRGVRWLDIY